MYFGLWITDKLLEGGMSLVRWVMFQFSTLFYQLIIFFYDIFIRLGTAEILTTSQVEKIYSRVTLLLGVFMLFKLSFSFVQYLINPETMSDKNKGAGKVITKAVIVVALLGFTPFIFRQAYNLQNALVESNVLGKIILGTSSANDNVSNFGSKLASYTFFSFYSFYDGEECEAADIEDMQDEVELNHSFELANDCLNEKGNSEKFAVYFPGLGLLCLAVGIFLLYIILSYCISVGMRTIQLAFLQLIAPIPILSYLGEDKDGAFSKWVKRCISTFIDLFIRIAIIYFVVYIINLLISDSDSYYWLLASTGNPTGRTKKWLIIVIILALLMFAKKAPELIKEILPQGIGSNIGFGFSKNLKDAWGIAKKPIGIAGGAAIAGSMRLANAVGTARTNKDRDKAALRRNTFADYKNRESQILSDLNSGILSKREARRAMNKLNRDYSTRKAMKKNGVDDALANQVANRSWQLSRNNMLRGIGSGAFRTATGIVSGGIKGSKGSLKGVIDDNFQKNYNYSKFAASGAGLIDLAKEYMAGITGHATFGTNAYYGNLKYDIENGRKTLKDNIQGAQDARKFADSLDGAFEKTINKSTSEGSLANKISMSYRNKQAEVDRITNISQSGDKNLALEYLENKGLVTSFDGGYIQGKLDSSTITDLNSKLAQTLQIRGGKNNISQEDYNKIVSNILKSNGNNSVVTDLFISEQLSAQSAKLSQDKINLESALKIASSTALASSTIKEMAKNHTLASDITDFDISTSSYKSAWNETVTSSILARSSELLSDDIMSKVSNRLSFSDYVIADETLKSNGFSNNLSESLTKTLFIKDSSGSKHKYVIKDDDTIIDESGNSYNESNFMSHIKAISGSNETLIDNIRENKVLASAYESALQKDYISAKQGEDSQISAILTGFGNSDAVSQASAASHHVDHVKALDELNRNVTVSGVGGSPPGPGGPPPGPGGPPPGPGPRP